MTACPAYLGVTISNHADLEEIFHYDFLVFCPADFNATFFAPDLSVGDQVVTFGVRLKDARRTYDVYLTHMSSSDVTETRRQEAGVKPATLSFEQFSVVLKIVTASIAVLAFVFLSVYIYVEISQARLSGGTGGDERPWTYSYSFNDVRANGSQVVLGESPPRQPPPPKVVVRTPTDRAKSPPARPPSFLLTFIHVTLWVTYSLSFTFTVIFTIISLLVESDVATIAKVDTFQAQCTNLTLNASAHVDAFRGAARQREQELATGMQRACGSYVTERYERVSEAISERVFDSPYWVGDIY